MARVRADPPLARVRISGSGRRRRPTHQSLFSEFFSASKFACRSESSLASSRPAGIHWPRKIPNDALGANLAKILAQKLSSQMLRSKARTHLGLALVGSIDIDQNAILAKVLALVERCRPLIVSHARHPREETMASARRMPLYRNRAEALGAARNRNKTGVVNLASTWATKAGLTSIANKIELGAMRRSISVVMAPSHAQLDIIRARSKSMGAQ